MDPLAAVHQSIIDAINNELSCAGAEGRLTEFGIFNSEQYMNFSLFDHEFAFGIKQETEYTPTRYYLSSCTLAYEFQNRANNICDLVTANMAQFVAKGIITPMHKHKHYIGPADVPYMPVTVTVTVADGEVIKAVCPATGQVIYHRKSAFECDTEETFAGVMNGLGCIYHNDNDEVFKTHRSPYGDHMRVVLANDDNNDADTNEEDATVGDNSDYEDEDMYYTDCKVCIQYNREFTKTVTIIHDSFAKIC